MTTTDVGSYRVVVAVTLGYGIQQSLSKHVLFNFVVHPSPLNSFQKSAKTYTICAGDGHGAAAVAVERLGAGDGG